jgi:spoIIIJ-associated protein
MSEPNEDELIDEGWESPGDADPESGVDGSNGAPDEDASAPRDGEGRAAGTNGESRRRRRRRKPRQDDDDPVLPDDERAAKALEFVTTLVDEMEMDCTVRYRRPKPEEPNEIQLEITGRDSGRIIGKKGQVLAAVQYLTNRVVNRPGLEKRYVTVDAEGYRSRRDDTLASMARRLGKQAVTEGKIITFEPMNPRDRRVIHLALAKFDGVVTKSEGEGDERRVQIIPVRR